MSTPENDDLRHDAFLDRLEALRRKTGKTREEVYAMVGITRAMVHLVRKGERGVSQKTMDRLEEAELAAGIRRFGPTETKILDRIVGKPPKTRYKPSVADLESGCIKVPLEFRSGKPPRGIQSPVKLKAPDTKTAAGIMVELLLEEDFDRFIGHCLPPDVHLTSLLSQLTPECYLKLAEVCLALTFGMSWEKQLPNLAHEFRTMTRQK